MAKIVKRRTEEELEKADFNYCIAFHISPSETDLGKIRKAIQDYTKSSPTPIEARIIELKNDAFAVMCDDAIFDEQYGDYIPNRGGRALEIKAAKKFKIDEALKAINLIFKGKSSIFKSEISAVWKMINGKVLFFDECELITAIKSDKNITGKIVDDESNKIDFTGIESGDNKKAISQRIKSLVSTAKKILPINHPNPQNLYEVLNLPTTATESEIKKAREELDAKQKEFASSDKNPRTAISNICSTIKEWLLDNKEKRQMYDQYLILKSDVWSVLLERKSYGLMQLPIDDFRDLVQKAAKLLNISANEAQTLIATGCQTLKITVEGDAAKSDFEECPFCGKLYTKGAKVCDNCGKSLEELCWNCGKLMRISRGNCVCKTCGATKDAQQLFLTSCQNFDKLCGAQNTAVADLQSALLQVKNVVPNYAANSDSTVAKKISAYEVQIKDKIAQEETVGKKYREDVAKIQQYVARRECQTALSLAKALVVKYPSYCADNSRKLIGDITATVQSAQRQVDSAKQYIAQGNINLAITTLVKALEACSDHTEAKQIMQKYPPKAVTNLRVSVVKNKIKLEWTDSVKQDLVTYTLIKKIGMPPSSADDGAIVDSGLSICFYEDANLIPGIGYYYAVFAERGGIKSSPAVTSSAATVLLDVKNYKQQLSEVGVKVTWEAPQNIASTEVWKKSGAVAPSRPGDGTQVASSADGFTDEGAKGSSAYLIVCCYAVNGKKVYSKGVSAIFKPYDKITPLENVKIGSLGGQEFAFSCRAGYTGKISLYCLDKKLPIAYDTQLQYIDFGAICKGIVPVDSHASANGDLLFSLPKGKVYFIYPVVSTDQLFIVSAPQLVSTVTGITNFKFKQTNGVVAVTGNVPAEAKEIVAKIGTEKYATSVDDEGESLSYKADCLRNNGELLINLRTDTSNYISLFVKLQLGGIETYSPPVVIEPPIEYTKPTIIRYSLKYETSATKNFKIEITLEADSEMTTPSLVLKGGYPRPTNRNSGSISKVIDPVSLKKGLFSKKYTGKVVITSSPKPTVTKFDVFINEDSANIQLFNSTTVK